MKKIKRKSITFRKWVLSRILTNSICKTGLKDFEEQYVIISDEKGKAKTGIPCLGGLPYIGAAFSKNMRKVDKKNIVIFMRPHIINTYQDMTSVTTSQEETFRENSGTPLLEEEFDEGLELLKTVAE